MFDIENRRKEVGEIKRVIEEIENDIQDVKRSKKVFWDETKNAGAGGISLTKGKKISKKEAISILESEKELFELQLKEAI